MIDNGYAIPYDGGKKNKPDEWEWVNFSFLFFILVFYIFMLVL